MKKQEPLIGRDRKTMLIPELRKYIQKEWEEEIGELKAELLLDFISSLVGPEIYSCCLKDCSAFLSSRFEDLLLDMEQIRR